VLLLLASLLVTEPVVSHPFSAPPAGLFGTSTKTVALARTDTGAVACWTDSPRVVCAQLLPAGGLGPEVVLDSALAGGNDAQPAVGWNGRELLVAFEELGPPNRVVLSRLDRGLRPLAPPRTLTYATDGGPAPSVAWNGREWLVTQRVFAMRLTPALDVIATVSAESPVVEGAAAGDDFVFINMPISRTTFGPCIWIPWYGCSRQTIITNEWTATLVPGGAIALPLPRQPLAASATLASRGRGVLFVWPELDPRSGVALAATPLDAARLGQSHPAAIATDLAEPRVAATAGGALVVWEERGDIRAVLLRADDTPDGDPFFIAATSARERHPSVLALDHGEYLVVYELDGRLATRFVLTQTARRRSR
jgi:hypothetical protein